MNQTDMDSASTIPLLTALRVDEVDDAAMFSKRVTLIITKITDYRCTLSQCRTNRNKTVHRLAHSPIFLRPLQFPAKYLHNRILCFLERGQKEDGS